MSIASLIDTVPRLEAYLKEHFNGAAECWLYEPFDEDVESDNGLTLVLTRDPHPVEYKWLVDKFDGFAVRWKTPSGILDLDHLPKPEISVALERDITVKPPFVLKKNKPGRD